MKHNRLKSLTISLTDALVFLPPKTELIATSSRTITSSKSTTKRTAVAVKIMAALIRRIMAVAVTRRKMMDIRAAISKIKADRIRIPARVMASRRTAATVSQKAAIIRRIMAAIRSRIIRKIKEAIRIREAITRAAAVAIRTPMRRATPIRLTVRPTRLIRTTVILIRTKATRTAQTKAILMARTRVARTVRTKVAPTIPTTATPTRVEAIPTKSRDIICNLLAMICHSTIIGLMCPLTVYIRLPVLYIV